MIGFISEPIMFVTFVKTAFLVSVKLETTATSRESIEVQLMNHVTITISTQRISPYTFTIFLAMMLTCSLRCWLSFYRLLLISSPSNEENYISFSKDFIVDRDGKLVEITRNIRFLDTFRFMPRALDKLVRNITIFPETQKWLNPLTRFRKDVYPYEYLDSFDKFALSAFVDKRYLVDKVNTLPYGYSHEDFPLTKWLMKSHKP